MFSNNGNKVEISISEGRLMLNGVPAIEFQKQQRVEAHKLREEEVISHQKAMRDFELKMEEHKNRQRQKAIERGKEMGNLELLQNQWTGIHHQGCYTVGEKRNMAGFSSSLIDNRKGRNDILNLPSVDEIVSDSDSKSPERLSIDDLMGIYSKTNDMGKAAKDFFIKTNQTLIKKAKVVKSWLKDWAAEDMDKINKFLGKEETND